MAEVRKKGRKVVGSGYGSPSNSKRDGPYNALAKVQQKMAINRKGRRARQPSFKIPNQIQMKMKESKQTLVLTHRQASENPQQKESEKIRTLLANRKQRA